MAEDTDNLELTDRQKTHLLHIALGPPASSPPLDADERRGDLLCDLLRCPLPTPAPERRASSSVHGGPFPGFRTIPLAELLRDPRTDIEVLRRVKEYAKSLGRDAGSDMQKDVFLAVYFAAIAAATVFHGVRITGHSDRDLGHFFSHFAKATWMPVSLAGLFATATQSIPARAPDDSQPRR